MNLLVPLEKDNTGEQFNFNGGFRINPKWTWGWDFNAYSDKKFVPDYSISTLGGYGSQQNVRLHGHSGRNTFDAHFYRFEVFQNNPENCNTVPKNPFFKN